MDKIKDHTERGIEFDYISNVFEIFSPPLNKKVDFEGSILEIDDAENLFRTSVYSGLNELYLPSQELVKATSGKKRLQFSRRDFIRCQLELFSAETVYYIFNKVDFSVDGFIDEDYEYNRNNEYNPDIWLSEYSHESKEEGLAFIERIRKEYSNDFYETLIDHILDDNFGLLTHEETDLVEDFSQSSNYDGWDVKLGLIFKGKFYPYIEPGCGAYFAMDDFKINRIWVRNYDEN
ncbi:hypothetical protein N9X12_04890 [Alphaproteobacteria bacterium]|nr:hypothetical protein [Alphaproteobacteria bacterium]